MIGLLIFIGTHDEANQMDTIERVAWMFGGILAGVAASACLYHYLYAHYDQADALLQVAKFQERSIRTRRDAVELVDKIREEVSKDESGPNDLAEEESPVNRANPTPEPVENGDDGRGWGLRRTARRGKERTGIGLNAGSLPGQTTVFQNEPEITPSRTVFLAHHDLLPEKILMAM